VDGERFFCSPDGVVIFNYFDRLDSRREAAVRNSPAQRAG
jgi:hypothetical protein